MIEYRKGDLLDVTSGVIAHGVNCQGVMGSGVAKAIREKYPKAYISYRKMCYAQEDSYKLLGEVLYVEVAKNLAIANCFTQDFYGTNKRHVNYEAVAKCFSELHDQVAGFDQLNIPKIGAGLGGGDWNVIESIIKSEYKSDVIVWEL